MLDWQTLSTHGCKESEMDHDHEWGQIEYAHFTGNPHRKCQIEGCHYVSLDLYDDIEED